MRQFTGKTVEEAIAAASEELSIPQENLVYKVLEEKKGLFGKRATIGVYDQDDAAEYAQEYLKNAIGAMGIEIETQADIDEEIIRITIDSKRNPALIGKGGHTLQALNELTRLAVSNKFHHRYRILLDVNGYKEDKYGKLIHIAKREAKNVLRTKTDVKLDTMTPDERRVVHNALANWDHIKTESSGEGNDRAITIKYVD